MPTNRSSQTTDEQQQGACLRGHGWEEEKMELGASRKAEACRGGAAAMELRISVEGMEALGKS